MYGLDFQVILWPPDPLNGRSPPVNVKRTTQGNDNISGLREEGARRRGHDIDTTGWRSNEERKLDKEQRKRLKFSHVHPLVPALAPGLGPGLERSRVVKMLEEARRDG